ncbi:hypothetical protein IPV26_21500 [Brucella pituitosa]|uniref:Uncharacterized protein n=2 Tax=Brucella pituitosa TaxID=571256 RepID=A0ABS3K5R5_9HYPH|nr:hypothetical protein [Brucella pituitosa]
MPMRSLTERIGSPPRPTSDAASWIGLAATPTFALMAWISVVGSQGMTMCSGASTFFPIDDMAVMYVLMSVFHLSPWMKLSASRLRRTDTQTIGD